VSDRTDFLKSLFRHAADLAGSRVRGLRSVARIREAVRAFGDQQATLDETAIASALARSPGIDAVSVTVRGGAVRIEAAFDDERELSFSLRPTGARFAPRGAKEPRFQVEPPELARQSRVRDAAGALGGIVAMRIWGMFLPNRSERAGSAFVETGGGGSLSVDLRTVPAVRKLEGAGALQLVLDVFEVRAVHAENGGLRFDIKLPSLARG
jgi:hypothetical protein